jgi:hypothetical protein
MQCLALIGDIERSRALENRAAVQERLESICRELNDRRDYFQLLSPFTLTLGDEFQALFRKSGALWEALFQIEASLVTAFNEDGGAPRVRFGTGVGAIDTRINEQSSIGMDGPAFHRARAAIEQLKESKTYYRVLGLNRGQQLATHALDLVSHNRSAWNANRVIVMSHLLRGLPVSESAEFLAISREAVYKNIRQGNLESVAGLFKGLSEMIDEQIAGGG